VTGITPRRPPRAASGPAHRKVPAAVLPSPAMTENAADTCPLLPMEEVAQAVRELAKERTLEGFAARFLDHVRRWAAPSAVLAAARDPAAEGGWRLLPALCTGSGPLGAERAVRQLIEELPEDLTTARLVRPGREIPGAKMRPNCLVPWAWEGESGVLMLRGVSGAGPANLADAIGLLSAPAWPRVLGGPAERIEGSVAELGRLAERLREEADRQVERLQAARTPAEPAAPAADPDAAARQAEQEQQLTTAKAEIDRLSGVVDFLKSEGAARQAEREQQLTGARAEVDRLSALVDSLRAEGGAERLAQEQSAAAAAKAEARAAKEELVQARESEVRLKGLLEQLQSEKAASAWRREEERTAEETSAEKSRAATKATEEALAAAQKQLEEAEASVARLIVEREELRQQVTTLEKALGEAEEERDEFHRESTRLESRLHALGVAQPPAAAAEAAAGAAGEPKPLSTESVEALRRALAVMRRTPFLPPPLRVAAQEAEVAAGAKTEGKEAWARVVILDRDMLALEPLAGQLESAGLDVKIASHPEEIALLLKTPEGRGLDAAICDVLAFRPDQNVAGIFRGWEKDRAGLALFLSFSRDSAPEVERAQRVPHSLTRGRVRRPLDWTELMSMLQPLRNTAS
jgi:hypothetical protein